MLLTFQKIKGIEIESFGINPDSLTTHFLCSGATGTGKTNIANGIIIGLNEINKKSTCMDIKRDTRHLIRQIPLLVIKLPNPFLRWNILSPPPGVSRQFWHRSVLRLFVETTFLAEGVESLFQENLDWLSKTKKDVNFHDLYNFIKSRKVFSLRDKNWVASGQNRLGAFKSIFGNMFNSEERFALEDLTTNYNVCFELDQIAQFQSFFASLIPSYLFLYRLMNNLRGNELKNAIFFDEANVIVGKTIVKRHSLMADPTLLQLIRLGREFGLGCLWFTNQPSAIDDTVKAQSGIKIMMRLGHYPDILDKGRSMGLTKEQMDCIIDAPPGVGIVKKFGVKPFLCQFEYSKIEKNVTDKEIEENNYRLIKGTKFEKYFKPISRSSTSFKQSESKTVQTKTESLSSQEKVFLFDIYNRHFLSMSERYKTLNLSAGKGNRIVKTLIKNGFCKIIEINLGGRGGLTKFLEITVPGFKTIKMPPIKYTKGTGFEHWFWQNKITENLKHFENIKAAIEANLKGKFIDILVTIIDDKEIKIAVEISITSIPEKEKENIIKDIDSGIDYVIVACEKNKIQKIRKMIITLDKKYQSRAFSCFLFKLLKIQKSDEIINILRGEQ